ncbi:hypothetical protein CAJAP_00262 [Camponotus japonicus]|jgi:hypothetical protein
MRH